MQTSPQLVFFMTKPNSTPSNITTAQVKHIAKLSDIPVTDAEVSNMTQAFEETLAVVSNLQSVDVTGVEPTHQVTGLENVTRQDIVETDRMFSQSEALANGHQVFNGYFVVGRLIDKDSA